MSNFISFSFNIIIVYNPDPCATIPILTDQEGKNFTYYLGEDDLIIDIPTFYVESN